MYMGGVLMLMMMRARSEREFQSVNNSSFSRRALRKGGGADILLGIDPEHIPNRNDRKPCTGTGTCRPTRLLRTGLTTERFIRPNRTEHLVSYMYRMLWFMSAVSGGWYGFERRRDNLY